jgi:hypothetical protein
VANELTIHIGPPKTATTTIQKALSAARDDLLARGVLYPKGFGNADIHLWAAIDLARQVGLDFDPTPFSRALFDEAQLHRGAWTDLLHQTLTHDGPVIWSSEGFTYLGDEGVDALARAVADIPTRLVLVARPPAQVVVSAYVEQARRTVVEPFDTYVRCHLTHLARGVRHESDYGDVRRLIQRWAQSGIPIQTVQAIPDLNDDVVRSALAAVAPMLTEEALPERENVSMSAMGTAAWQAHLRRTKPRLVGAMSEVLTWFGTAHPAVLDSRVGGRLALAPETAALVDAAFSYQTPQEEADAARSALLDTLGAASPIVAEAVPGPGMPDEAWARTVASLRSRQLRADGKWAVVDAASVALRRRRPVRAQGIAP